MKLEEAQAEVQSLRSYAELHGYNHNHGMLAWVTTEDGTNFGVVAYSFDNVEVYYDLPEDGDAEAVI